MWLSVFTFGRHGEKSREWIRTMSDDIKHFIMDNFYYMEAVPAPGAFALGMVSFVFGTSRRRK